MNRHASPRVALDALCTRVCRCVYSSTACAGAVRLWAIDGGGVYLHHRVPFEPTRRTLRMLRPQTRTVAEPSKNMYSILKRPAKAHLINSRLEIHVYACWP
jgi:hypothetical protein